MRFIHISTIVLLGAWLSACGAADDGSMSSDSGAGAEDALSGEPIKVGVLHSLSGSMAISETTLKDTVEMLVDEQNARGGLLGRPL